MGEPAGGEEGTRGRQRGGYTQCALMDFLFDQIDQYFTVNHYSSFFLKLVINGVCHSLSFLVTDKHFPIFLMHVNCTWYNIVSLWLQLLYLKKINNLINDPNPQRRNTSVLLPPQCSLCPLRSAVKTENKSTSSVSYVALTFHLVWQRMTSCI